METGNKENNISPQHKVRRALAHSHAIYFILFLTGVVLDIVFRFEIFTNSSFAPIGLGLLVFGTSLILWAEKTPHGSKGQIISKEHFFVGPYRYTRNPTHFGLFLLVMGFGFIANAFFVVLTTLISFCLEKFIFQDKAEKMLVEKYGASYLEYKKTVRF
ncbi:hypothetical protein A3H53_00625 [Candidatus Nomurabacteria bacterium RIFCSPLOWO2_02_FULL_40_10]|uniref:Steroid 5-alpha reductase C-terminal domain-containing protein n=2 Tax=Candidatus Nomuraibacteriota TaxID=1752729 RepID=A0A1F6XY79_9BACT|nr:MAG: hypothetical protein A2642_02310 [Candidatus Nomurabacteria bacterium RIFCSPHIGHO2_01_FULL_39_10]OGI99075.1 MAG: hypothetical protein A3H53_00625 [Candidatus Nomurabacteria bacterium RIFCSPLOWO2_02_FULL_40_10]